MKTVIIALLFSANAAQDFAQSFGRNLADESPWLIHHFLEGEDQQSAQVPASFWSLARSACPNYQVPVWCDVCSDATGLHLDSEQRALLITRPDKATTQQSGRLRAICSDHKELPFTVVYTLDSEDFQEPSAHQSPDRILAQEAILSQKNPSRQLACNDTPVISPKYKGELFYYDKCQGYIRIDFQPFTYDEVNCNPPTLDPDLTTRNTSYIYTDSCTYNSVTNSQDCTFDLNAESWIKTDGFSFTIDSNSSAIRLNYSYLTGQRYRLSTSYDSDSFSFRFAAHADESLCQLTALTTDNAMTGQTINYPMSTGQMDVTMDKITAQTPATCGYTAFTYGVLGEYWADPSEYGITVDQSTSPPTMQIDTSIDAQTVDMYWYALPDGNSCQSPILKSWTLNIYCMLTAYSLDGKATEFSDSYTATVEAELLINFPTFTQTPSTCGHTATFAWNVDGSSSEPAWLDVYDTYFRIYTTSNSYIGTYAFAVSWYVTDGADFSQTHSYSFTLNYENKLCAATSATTTVALSSSQEYFLFQGDVTVAISQYSESPSCEDDPSNAFIWTPWSSIDWSKSEPSWLIGSDYLTYMTINSADTSLGGEDFKLQQTTVWPDNDYTKTDTIRIIFTNPCDSTTFTSQTIDDVYYMIGSTAITKTLPRLNDAANESYGSDTENSICGDQTVVVTSTTNGTPTYLTDQQVNKGGYTVLTIWTDDVAQNGYYLQRNDYDLTNYSASMRESFFVYLTVITGPTVAYSAQTYIFATTQTISLSGYQMDPAGDTSISFTYQVYVADTATLAPSWISVATNVDGGVQLTIYTSDSSNVATWYFQVVGTSVTSTGDTSTLSHKNAYFYLNVIDECPGTGFTYSTGLDDKYIFIAGFGSITSIWIDDTTNLSYNSGAAPSMCGGQQISEITFQSGGSVTWITSAMDADGNTPNLQVDTSDSSLAGAHSMYLHYQLVSYTDVTELLPLNLFMCEVSNPSDNPGDMTYSVGATKRFSMSQVSITSDCSIGGLISTTNQVVLDDGSALPSFISVVQATKLGFTLSSTDVTDRGSYTVLYIAIVTLTNDQGTSTTNVDSFTITVPDSCLSNAFVDQSISSAYAFQENFDVTLPLLTDDINVLFGSDPNNSVCGGQSVAVYEDGSVPSYISLSTDISGQSIISVTAADDSSLIGEHTFTIDFEQKDYSSVTTSLTMAVYICKFVEAISASDQTYQIGDAALTLSVDHLTVNPSSASDHFTITNTITLADGSSLPTFITATESATTIDFSIESTDATDRGTYDVLITTVGSSTQAGSQTYTSSFTLTVPDPCLGPTVFLDQKLEEKTILVGASGASTITLPIISDTINDLYGSDPEDSVCSKQTVSVTESSVVPSYLTQSTNNLNYVVLSLATSDTSLVGTHTLDAVYTLDDYAKASSTTLTQTLYICDLTEPATYSDQEYEIGQVLPFSVDLFTVTPSSDQITITYTVKQLSGATLPSFITYTESASSIDFTVESQQVYDAGTYNIKVEATATDTSSRTVVKYTSFQLVVPDPCLLASFTDQSTTEVYTLIDSTGSMVQVDLPILTDSVNEVFGSDPEVSVCGGQTLTITESGLSPSYISTVVYASGLNRLTVATTDNSLVGTHTIDIDYELDKYSGVTTSLQMTAYLCEFITPSSFPSQSYEILDATLTWSVDLFTVTPDLGLFTITHEVTQAKSAALPSFLTFIENASSSTLDFSLYSSEFADSARYTIYITATVVAKNGASVQVVESFTIEMLNVCNTATFVSQTLTQASVLISAVGDAVTYTLPRLTDTANAAYGTDSQNSVCGDHTVTLVQDETLVYPKYVTDVSLSVYGYTVLTMATTESEMQGVHTLTIFFLMDDYSGIETYLTLDVNVVQMTAGSTPAAQAYQVGDSELKLEIDPFVLDPSESLSDFVVTYAFTLEDGSDLPTFISEPSELVLSFLSEDDSDAGPYVILITATATGTNEAYVQGTNSFALTVSKADVTDLYEEINLPPEFQEEVPTKIEVQVGAHFVYQIPQAESVFNETLEDADFTLEVQIDGLLNFFMTYDEKDREVRIAKGATTEQNAGIYSFVLTLTDPDGHTLETVVFFEIVSNQEESVVADEDSLSVQETALVIPEGATAEMIEYLEAIEMFRNFPCTPEWNFKDQLNLARETHPIDRFDPPVRPTVKLGKISKTGEVELIFSKNMIAPPDVELIKNVTLDPNASQRRRRLQAGLSQEVQDNFVSAAQPSINPGYYSEDANLGFGFNITKYENRTLTLQMNFSDTSVISKVTGEPDELEITFYGNMFFFDEEGQFISENTTIKKTMPSQFLVAGWVEDMMVESGEDIADAMTAIVTCNVVLNIFLSMGLQYLMGMVETQQLILFLPLFDLQLPANTQMFFSFVMQIVAFDIVPTDDFYNDELGEVESDPINENFAEIGFEGGLFLYNLGSMILTFLIYPLFIVITWLLGKCKRIKKVHKWAEDTKKGLFWSEPIVTITEAYSVLAMCTFINLNLGPNFYGQNMEVISAVLTYLCLVVLFFYPPFLVTFLYCNWDHLENEDFKDKFGAMYEGLKLEHGRWVLIEPAWFLIRRLSLAVVVCQNRSLWVELLLFVWLVVIQVKLIKLVRPYEDPWQHFMHITNEVLVMMVFYTFLLQTDFVNDEIMQYKIGYVVIAFVVLHLLVNLGIIMIMSMIELNHRAKLFAMRRALRLKIRQKQQEESVKRILQISITKMFIVPKVAVAELSVVSEEVSISQESEEEESSSENSQESAVDQPASAPLTVRSEADKDKMNGTSQKLLLTDSRQSLDTEQGNLDCDETLRPGVLDGQEPIQLLLTLTVCQEVIGQEDDDFNKSMEMIDSVFKPYVKPAVYDPDAGKKTIASLGNFWSSRVQTIVQASPSKRPLETEPVEVVLQGTDEDADCVQNAENLIKSFENEICFQPSQDFETVDQHSQEDQEEELDQEHIDDLIEEANKSLVPPAVGLEEPLIVSPKGKEQIDEVDDFVNKIEKGAWITDFDASKLSTKDIKASSDSKPVQTIIEENNSALSDQEDTSAHGKESTDQQTNKSERQHNDSGRNLVVVAEEETKEAAKSPSMQETKLITKIGQSLKRKVSRKTIVSSLVEEGPPVQLKGETFKISEVDKMKNKLKSFFEKPKAQSNAYQKKSSFFDKPKAQSNPQQKKASKIVDKPNNTQELYQQAYADITK